MSPFVYGLIGLGFAAFMTLALMRMPPDRGPQFGPVGLTVAFTLFVVLWPFWLFWLALYAVTRGNWR